MAETACVVPFMREGHRDIAPLDDDAHVEARIVWRRLLLALWLIPEAHCQLRLGRASDEHAP